MTARQAVRYVVIGGGAAAALLLLPASAAWAQFDPAAGLDAGPTMSVAKLVIFLVLMLLLFLAGNWLAMDVPVLQKNQDLWFAAFAGAAVLALVLLLAVPIFAIGLILALLLPGGVAAAYVKWRNTQVQESAKVFTAADIKRRLKRLGRPEADGEIAAERAVHVFGATHLNEDFKLLYMKTNDFPIRLVPGGNEEQAAFDRGEALLNEAIRIGAGQLYLVPAGNEILLRYRVDGAVREGGKLDKKLGEAVIKFLKRLSELDTQEHRKPQMGRFVVLRSDKGSNVVVETAGSVRGEHLTARLQRRELIQMRLDKSGMRPEQLELLHKGLDHAGGGLIIMSAAPHSGRTVSMYATLREFDLYSKNVVAVEPQIAIEYPDINQAQIDKEGQKSLSEAVQAALRTDPDVVLVETVDNAETAQMMLAGAAAGKMMIGGLVANDAAEGVQLFMNLAGDSGSVSSVLLAATNQRLMRTLCPGCREAYRPNPDFLRKANLQAAKVDVLQREPKSRPVDKKGQTVVCPNCLNEGYSGHTVIYEVAYFDEVAREQLGAGRSVTEIRQQLRLQGQEFLQEEGLRKVVAGETSVAELLRVLKPGK